MQAVDLQLRVCHNGKRASVRGEGEGATDERKWLDWNLKEQFMGGEIGDLDEEAGCGCEQFVGGSALPPRTVEKARRGLELAARSCTMFALPTASRNSAFHLLKRSRKKSCKRGRRQRDLHRHQKAVRVMDRQGRVES